VVSDWKAAGGDVFCYSPFAPGETHKDEASGDWRIMTLFPKPAYRFCSALMTPLNFCSKYLGL
jgi:hypothetical protein